MWARRGCDENKPEEEEQREPEHGGGIAIGAAIIGLVGKGIRCRAVARSECTQVLQL
jgi:hypothetical protein